MDAGAFSDDKVVDATKGVIPVTAKDPKLSSKYNVHSIPSVKFIDQDGKVIFDLENVNPQAVADKINEIANKYKNPIDTAIESAKTDERVLAVFFKDDKEPSASTKSALGDDSLKELLDKVSLSEVDFKKDSLEAKTLKVASTPSIVILNPYLDSPAKKPINKLNGKKEAKDIKTALESAVRECDKAKEKNKVGEDALAKALEKDKPKEKAKALKDVISKFKGYAVAESAKWELDKLSEDK